MSDESAPQEPADEPVETPTPDPEAGPAEDRPKTEPAATESDPSPEPTEATQEEARPAGSPPEKQSTEQTDPDPVDRAEPGDEFPPAGTYPPPIEPEAQTEAPPFSNPSPDSEAQPDPEKEAEQVDAAHQGIPVNAPEDVVENAAAVPAPPDPPVDNGRVVLLGESGRREEVVPGEPVPPIRASAIQVEATAEVFTDNVDWFNTVLLSALSPYAHVTITNGPVAFNPQTATFYLP